MKKLNMKKFIILIFLIIIFKIFIISMMIFNSFPISYSNNEFFNIISNKIDILNDINNNTSPDIEPETIQIYDLEEGYLTIPNIPNLPKCNYSFNNLTINNSFLSYEDEKYGTKLGIDVSTYQGDIDWSKVKSQGIEFAIIRLGFRGYGKKGTLVVDSQYENNINGALNAGINVGVYFFSQAISVDEAIEEADFVIENLKNYNLEFPVCFDLEKIKFDDSARANNLTKEQRTEFAIAFFERIKQAGYKTSLYANAKWLTTQMDLTKLQKYGVWYADYQEKPIYPYDFTIWQYSETGVVDGILGNVDLNLYFYEK